MSQGQRSRSSMPLCKNNGLGYKSQTDNWIVVKLIQSICILATLKLTNGQCHKVKGQGQICGYVKITI